MTRNKLTAILICCVTSSIATAAGAQQDAWRVYSQEPNGNVHYYDTSRVELSDGLRRTWSRIRYKTSVMGASSFESLLEINCSERTEKIIQSTFFSDSDWEKPAMSTDMAEKPKQRIVKGSAADKLAVILCDQ